LKQIFLFLLQAALEIPDMKVAVIEPVGGHGGMNYYDFGLCRGLVAAGVEPLLYTCDETVVEPEAGFPVKLNFNRIYGPDAKSARAARYLWGLFRSLRDARSKGARITHFHLFHVTALEWISLRTARLFGCKVVVTVHDVESFSGNSPAGLARSIYGFADLLIVHNKVSANALSELSGGLSDKTVIIPHGNYNDYIKGGLEKSQALEKIGLDGAYPVLLFWGQIKEVKGLDILLEALPEVVSKVPSVRLVIAGKVWKDDFSRYGELIEKHGLDRMVTRHIRYIPDEMVRYYFNAADLVVLPYRKIYQSGVLLMAMSYGCPVMVSDLPGMTEVVEDGKTGFVFTGDEPASLSMALIKALSDSEAMDRVARAGRQKMETEYSWSEVGARTAAAYRSLARRGAGNCPV